MSDSPKFVQSIVRQRPFAQTESQSTSQSDHCYHAREKNTHIITESEFAESNNNCKQPNSILGNIEECELISNSLICGSQNDFRKPFRNNRCDNQNKGGNYHLRQETQEHHQSRKKRHPSNQPRRAKEEGKR